MADHDTTPAFPSSERNRLGIHSLSRCHVDDDGAHYWWTHWQETDRYIGEVKDGEGVVLIKVEHHRREPVNDTFWGMVWRTFTRDCIKWREVPYRAVYKPDEVRYQKE